MQIIIRICSDAEVDPYSVIKLFNFGLTVFISLFGLASNTLVGLVYRRTKLLSSTDVYLTALALSDNVQIIFISLYAYRYVYQLLFPGVLDWRPSGVVTLSGILITSMSQFVNTYIIVLLGVDRFLQVKRISLAKTWCQPRRAKISLAVITASAVVFCIPRWFEYIPLMIHYKETVDKCYGYFTESYGLGTSAQYRLIYSFILYILVMYFVPLVIISFTSGTLVVAIWKRARWLRKIQSEMLHSNHASRLKRTEVNAITTLVIVTISFILFQIPDMVLQFIWRLAPLYGPTASIFSYQLILLNSSINFIIYAVSSNAFRSRLSKVFRCLAANDVEGPENTMLGAHGTNYEPTLKSFKTHSKNNITKVS
ncbi:FMRFamide peptide receptor frpr-18-like isoform X2 [Watersipora subatra]|uniref:FMRFamide peptide receptor frpr-18-like isoform X2 n=1 Tax=Watersipora subatra TaxID=2589382 RepID=UPI00355C7B95